MELSIPYILICTLSVDWIPQTLRISHPTGVLTLFSISPPLIA